MGTVDVPSVDVAARDGRGHVVADEAVGRGGAEPCQYGRGHLAVAVAAQTAASDIAKSLLSRPSAGGRGRWASLRTRPWDDRRGRRLCRRDCAGQPWGMSHRVDEASAWLRCCRCKRRRETCLQAVAGKLLQRSHVGQEPPRFCGCSWYNCRHSHIELHILGSSQLGTEHAKSLWTCMQQFIHCWFANQGRRTLSQHFCR